MLIQLFKNKLLRILIISVHKNIRDIMNIEVYAEILNTCLLVK